MYALKMKSLAGALGTAALLTSLSASAANIVINGGFETGDFSGWSTSVNPTWDGVDSNAPREGTYAAFFGNPDGVSTISQSLTTLAGARYLVRFSLQNEADVTGNSTPNSFEFDWNGAAVVAFSNGGPFGYQDFAFDLTATGASTDITFKLSQTAAFFDLDAVSVALPEPSSAALAVLAGLAGAAVTRRRRT